MPKGYHHVTRDIRSQIYVLKATGTTLHQIAAIVGFHVSTISREIKRNTGGTLYKHLRHNGKKYNKRSSGKAGRGCIPNRVDITERPPIVEQKTRIGDWEGDTVISAVSKTAILTVVDRHSKFTRIKKLGRKTAENVRIAMKKVMTSLPYPVLTVTYDNGMEFAAHQDIAADRNTH